MDFELQTGLLIIGVVFIAAILIHGLIGIRRENKPVDISELDLAETDDNGDILRDRAGFDRHGVGVPKRIPLDEGGTDIEDAAEPCISQTTVAEQTPSNEVNTQQSADEEPSAEVQLDLGLDEPAPTMNTSIDFDVALETDNNIVEEPAIGDNDAQMTLEQQIPVFASPIIQEKEEYTVSKSVGKETPDVTAEHSVDPQSTASEESIEPLDVLVLNVVAGEDGEINGAQLLPTLLTLGFKFGDMDIFHRHVNATGQGDILFSLTNMVQPGTFDIENMEQFTTNGVALFMTLPHTNGNMETFNTMLNAAAKIAEAFDGQVLDGSRSTLTKQSTQHYVQRIREVERKLLLEK